MWFPILGLAIGLMLFVSVKKTLSTKAYLAKKLAPASLVPKGLTMLLVTAHLIELVKVMEHANIVTVSTAALLLAIAVASKSENQELH